MSTKLRFKRLALHVLPPALLAVLVGHFTMTLLYLMPVNPIKLRVERVVGGYIEPFFAQNWSLFAPDPLVDTRDLLVSCRVAAPEARETPWMNVTAPVRKLKQESILSPAERIDRVQMAGMYLAFQPEDIESRHIHEAQEDVSEEVQTALEAVLAKRRADRDTGVRLMNRIASAACDQRFGSGATSAVRVQVIITKPPPFSRRFAPVSTGKKFHTEFDWAPVEHVAPM